MRRIWWGGPPGPHGTPSSRSFVSYSRCLPLGQARPGARLKAHGLPQQPVKSSKTQSARAYFASPIHRSSATKSGAVRMEVNAGFTPMFKTCDSCPSADLCSHFTALARSFRKP